MGIPVGNMVVESTTTAPIPDGRMAAFYTFPCGIFAIGQEGDSIVSVQKMTTIPCEPDSHTQLTDALAQQLDEYFQGKRQQFDVPYTLRGTPFQNQVWAQLCRIPYGETRSYRDIAQALGNPRACRAVGMANHRNPLMILVPCHRVIGADGSLGGYAGGIEIKQFLLELEQKHRF